MIGQRVDGLSVSPELLKRWEARLQQSWWKPQADFLARMLQPFSWVYRALAGLHRLATRAAMPDPTAQAGSSGGRIPTVVIGNWIVGGAGKTPTALALVGHLQRQGWRPGLISRGHGRSSRDTLVVDPQCPDPARYGDEPLLIALKSRIPVVVGADRPQARRKLLEVHPEVDIVLSDDGLQHHRLFRDLTVVVVDERGIGNGLCIPAGPLRQPVPRAPDPSTLVVHSGAGPNRPGATGWTAHRSLRAVQSWSDWSHGRPLPHDGGWSALRERPLWAMAGIAVPQRFFTMLKAQGLHIRELPLPDHDPMLRAPWPAEAQDVVMTEKDAVKAVNWSTGPVRLWVARLDLVLPDDFLDAFDRRLAAIASPRLQASRPTSTP